ncbi:MAG: TIGR03768 family metallophosphoesterase [Deltaproteobacteria bacterium]|nr:TIGR03768 family metallophosphoesterase [Deltaproteobacteria bacterium]
MVRAGNDLQFVCGLTRREFVKYSVGTAACIYFGALNTGCESSRSSIAEYPIDSTVVTTTTRVLSFPVPKQPSGPNSGTGLYLSELPLIQEYKKYGYGDWQFSADGLPIVMRYDLMPDPYPDNAATRARIQKFANFFAITDIHITDKEAPNQLIYLQQEDPVYSGPNTSIYSPVMLCTTHVLDAAMQTINALHKKNAFDFGISLGDTCNSTSYNELRWYMDVIDGKVITPSSGDQLGADTIDYQRPFKAAGLDKSIPWYQAMGNHDHFFLGSFPVDADPALGLRNAYLGDTVWPVADFLVPTIDPKTFPALFDMKNMKTEPKYYQGVLDGSTPTGTIIHAGAVEKFSAPPKVAADSNRRSLLRTEWIEEFFNTSTEPVGHGFGLVDPSQPSGFACYSFLPKANVPLKIIVLDDTQSETDGSRDIHGHGFLDANRWAWLQRELKDGQAANQLMIIAAHVPIGVAAIGSETEWWESHNDPNATEQNAVTLTELVAMLQDTPNLLMWVAGHRHLNTVKAFVSPDRANAPEKGFWQVETSSLRDYPQQLRTFEIYLNSDYTVSIVTINVDPAVREGTPAATSRYYSIATQQIIQSNLNLNNPNLEKAYDAIPVETMDPSRPQDNTQDSSIFYGSVPGVPYCASYNAELFKQLSPTMINALKAQFSATEQC